MSNHRMAGDKLNEPTKESNDAKQALSRSARNKQIREEIANDPERSKDRLAQIGEKYDLSGYSDKEVIMAFQGEDFGDKDYARLTGNKIDEPKDNTPKEDDMNVGINPVGPGTPSPEDKPVYTPARPSFPAGPGFGVGGQYVNQNNDINSTVTGDKNTVTNFQDNSIAQGGGLSSRAKMLRDRYVADVSRFVGA